MFSGQHRLGTVAVLVLAAAALGPVAPGARASAGPDIAAAWSTEVLATSARLRAEINPQGSRTTYHFDYLAEAAYEANLASGREGFYGARKAPAGTDPSIGEGTSPVAVFQSISSLSPHTTYRYRVLAANGEAASLETNPSGAPLLLTTQDLGGAGLLADNRAWEMVSPLDKNGGQVLGPGGVLGGGVFQAAAAGGSLTYSSTASFGPGAEGAPDASQYIARRAPGEWASENITAPMLSGSYGEAPDGAPYQLFSGDLARGLLLNGEHCRDGGEGCPVANRPLPGSGAPEGFQDYYLRNNEDGTYTATVTGGNAELNFRPEEFSLALAGASPDLRHIVLSTCGALTPGATEAPGSEGCDPEEPNLYEWEEGRLRLVNTSPGATLAAQGAGAISADGSRVYFTEVGGLYLREGSAAPRLVAAGASFQGASSEGSLAFYTKEEAPEEERLYRYSALTHTAAPIGPAEGVAGVLGASVDGSSVYFQTNGHSVLLPPTSPGLYRWSEGSVTRVAPGASAAQPGDYPPTTGTARVSADGGELLFLSTEPLTRYDNTDQVTGEPDAEVYLYAAGSLTCLSCNPTGERPLGPSGIPGAYANGSEAALGPGQILTDSYKPRALSIDGRRAFFESADALVLQDTNNARDVYEWEAQGEGSCAAPGGCLSLASSGRSAGGAGFLDASGSGADVFFLTAGSLEDGEGKAVTPYGNVDPGSSDVYDAREGGGFPEPPNPIPCNGDACQVLPPEPEDPEPGTLREGPGNPLLVQPASMKCRRGRHLVKGRCVRNHHRHKRHHHRRRRRHR